MYGIQREQGDRRDRRDSLTHSLSVHSGLTHAQVRAGIVAQVTVEDAFCGCGRDRSSAAGVAEPSLTWVALAHTVTV